MPCPQNTPCGQSKTARPEPTLGKMLKAAVAILTSKSVPQETVNARMKICRKPCAHLGQNASGYTWCALCGCRVNGQKGLLNLASYEENLPGLPGYNSLLPEHGCHFPGRLEGKGGWPLPTSITPALQNSNTPVQP